MSTIIEIKEKKNSLMGLVLAYQQRMHQREELKVRNRETVSEVLKQLLLVLVIALTLMFIAKEFKSWTIDETESFMEC